jgi:hypothetical protein
MEMHICLLIWIILSFGLFGGTINFFIVYSSKNKEAQKWWLLLLKSLIFGLGASMLVPLFLDTISSNILEFDSKQPFPEKRYFLLAGFCLIAAIFSKRFIEDLYSIVMKAKKEAEEANKRVSELEDSKSEIDDDDTAKLISSKFTISEKSEDKESMNKVVRAILQSNYSFRTLSGIAKSSGLSKEIVANALTDLKAKGLAESKLGKQGNYVWKIIVK